MIIFGLPPAVSAPQDPCDTMPATQMHVMCTTVTPSPDGRWKLVVAGDDDGRGAAKLRNLRLPQNPELRGALVDVRTGRIIYKFEMERSAWVHWLPGGQILIVNYFQGSGTTMPLVFQLKQGPVKEPIDLSALVFPDVLKRIHHRRNQVYHYYVNYVSDEDRDIVISAEPQFVLKGDEGPGDGRCYLYRVDKATFSHYRFIKEVPEDNCPSHPEEHWS